MNTSTLTRRQSQTGRRTKKPTTTETDQTRPTGWDPDRRWHHPYLVTMWLFTLGFVPHEFGLPAWIMAPPGLVGTLLVRYVARRRHPVDKYGPKHPQQVVWHATISGLAATAWLVWAGYVSPLNLQALGALVLGALVLGGGYAGLRTAAPNRQDRAAAVAQARELSDFKATWTKVLAAAGFPQLRVRRKVNNRAGYTLTLVDAGTGAGAGVDADKVTPATVDALTGARAQIASAASRAFARTGAKIGARGIRVEETDHAHVFLMHVTTIDVIRESIPYPDDPSTSSIRQAQDIGMYEVGDLILLMFRGVHAKIVGATRSGKSVLVNSIIGRFIGCVDTVLWVGGSTKLIPLIWPWLLPWITGRTRRPVIDWIAGERQEEVLMMLAAGYRAANARAQLLTDQPTLEPSNRMPALVLIVDEASTVLSDSMRIETFDGRRMNASELIMHITQIGAAVNVTVLLATQYGLMPAFGDFGPEIHRNLTLRIALRTMTPSDGTSTLVGMDRVDTTKLKHHSMLVQPSTEDPRALPGKSYALDGAEVIAPIAERATPTLAYLDKYTALSCGRDYAHRWDADRQESLLAAIQRDGKPVPDLTATARACQADLGTLDLLPGAEEVMGSAASGTYGDRFSSGSGPDASAMNRGLDELGDKMAAANSRMGAVWRTPEPWRSIAEALTAPSAPKDFVSSRRLAIVLDRVAADAPDEELNRAAAELGREINRAQPNLKTRQATANGRQVRGYDVKRLWKAIHAVAGGDPLPPDDTEN